MYVIILMLKLENLKTVCHGSFNQKCKKGTKRWYCLISQACFLQLACKPLVLTTSRTILLFCWPNSLPMHFRFFWVDPYPWCICFTCGPLDIQIQIQIVGKYKATPYLYMKLIYNAYKNSTPSQFTWMHERNFRPLR